MRGCVREPLQPSMWNLAISKRRKGHASCLNFSFPTLSVSVQQLINKQWILWTQRRMGLILCPPPALDTHLVLSLPHKGNLTGKWCHRRVRGSNMWCKSGFVGLCGLNVTFLLLLIHRRFGFNALAALGGVLVGSLSSDYYMNTSQHHRSPITQYSPRSTSVWVVFRQRESVRGEDEMKADIKEAI